MTANLDILAGTPRRLVVAKVLRDRHPGLYSVLPPYVEDARAILEALDEHAAFPPPEELREVEGSALTQEQEIRDRAVEHASAHVPAADLHEWVSTAVAIAAYISTGEVPATERAP